MSPLELLILPDLETPETVPDVAIVPANACLSCPQNPYATGSGHSSHPPEAGSPPVWWSWTQKQARETNRALLEKITSLEAENRALKQQIFGRKSEQGKGRGFDPGLSPKEAGPPRSKGHQPGRKSPGRTIHSTLPAVVETHDLPSDRKCCPGCFRPFASYGSPETSEILEVEVRPHRRVIRRPRYRKTCSCPGTRSPVLAPPAPRLVPRGKLGISVWVWVLVDKFAFHRPTARLLKDLRLLGLPLSQGTVTDGLRRLAPFFEPLYQAVVAKSRTASFSQADETRYLVFEASEGKANNKWWLWILLTADAIVYVVDPTRSATVPLAHFSGRSGILVVDRYSSYKAMARKNVGMVLAFCWAHVRRDFIVALTKRPERKAWAGFWLDSIGTLYRLAEDPEVRVANHGPIRDHLAFMRSRAEKERDDLTLPAECRKPATSLLAHWDGLTVFLDHPEVPLDNNASERGLRGPVVGRKNFWGFGKKWSAELSVFLYTLFATWSLSGLNLRTVLSDYLSVCAPLGKAPEDLRPWLPWEMSPGRKEVLSRSSSSPEREESG